MQTYLDVFLNFGGHLRARGFLALHGSLLLGVYGLLLQVIEAWLLGMLGQEL